MNESKNRYFVKNAVDGEFEDISTKFDGVAVLKVDNMLSRGKPINIYTAQWVDSQFEDYMITTMQDGEPKVVRENPDISITFIVRQTYAENPIDVQTVHDDFVGYLTGSDVWIRSDYSGGKIVHGVCLDSYEPTTVSLQRGLKSYIMGTIKLHSLGSVFDYFVSTSLRRVTLSHQDDGIVRNQPYSNSLVYSSDNGLVLVTITMGGTDITSTAYNHATKEISIPQVTGNIVISAESSPKIVFADQNVKSLCVSNWGGNYLQGEITEYEAAQVTSLNGVFKANNQISSFNELKYFTGITSLYNDYTNSAYNGQLSFCSNLTKITLPAAPISNWGGAFRQTPVAANTGTITLDMTPITAQEITLNAPWRECYRLIYIKLDGKVYKGSMQYGFRNCGILATIEINGTADFTQVKNYFNCFYSCANLTTITGTIVGISQDIDIHWSPLTRASAMVLINGLAQTSTPKKITFSWATYNLLSDDDIAIANAKGWNVETYVQFEDPNLKAFILEQFPDNVGKTTANEITNLELASITSLGLKFMQLTKFNNDQTKPFYTFNEFRFFTGLTSFGCSPSNAAWGEFYGCQYLREITIPRATIRGGMRGLFDETNYLQTLDLSPLQATGTFNIYFLTRRSGLDNSLTRIVLPNGRYDGGAGFAFGNRAKLATIEIDGTADWGGISAYGNMFFNCTSLTTITGTIIGIKENVTLQYSPLDKPSALMLLNGLAQVATAKKITFSYSTYNLLTDADIAIATAKNWQVETIIEWEDNNLRDYILAQFPNNVGLTYSGQITNLELATITDLGGKFRELEYFDENNTKPFYTFNEFKFFTGVTRLDHTRISGTQTGQFYHCYALKYITAPANVWQLGGAFRGCNIIEQVDLTRISGSGLYISSMLQMANNNSLKSITLPATTYNTDIYGCFYENEGLEVININGTANFSNLSNCNSAFYKCESLTTITGTITGIKANISFSYSPLTHDTALMLLNGLAQVQTAQKVTFKYSTYNLLSDADIAIATAKNWQVETIIEWEDNNLRDYILAQFPNNVGLTYSGQITNLELASITSLNNKFVNLAYFDENNTKPFYTFNEFRFFTGLTGFSQYANAQGQFYNCTKLQNILLPKLNLNATLDLRALFRGCYSLTSVDFTPFHAINYWIYYLISMPSTQTSVLTEITLPSGVYGNGYGGGSYARSAFAYCRNLTTINIDGVADFSGIASYQADDLSAKAFGYCYALTTITGTITGIKANIYFENSPLDHDTALMLLNGLATVETQQTITFSTSTYATLTAEEIAIATSKNWQVASA